MALQTSEDDENVDHHEFDEEVEETEDDLIENYRFLTKRCGALRQSPTAGALNTFEQEKQKQRSNQSLFLRQYSSVSENHYVKNNIKDESSTKQRCSQLNDSSDKNNNDVNYSTTVSRVPPTIYYDDTEDDDVYSHRRSFSVVKLFARMKTRLKHDRRYQSKASHELLAESDPQEWYELTKNVRIILTKVLLPDGGYDAMIERSKSHYRRQDSYRKPRETDPVLSKDNDEEKIDVFIDDELNMEDNEAVDQIIWQKFLTCPRGLNYRRCGICKAVDRQQFQGQLVYFYGVANNILIDENLKASGLG